MSHSHHWYTHTLHTHVYVCVRENNISISIYICEDKQESHMFCDYAIFKMLNKLKEKLEHGEIMHMWGTINVVTMWS